MNKKTVLLSFVLSGCVCVSLWCTNPVQMTGNSSQTPNAVVGTFYEPDGKTPAKNVRVYIRPHSSLAGVSGMETVPGPHDTSSVLTNNEGEFAFDTSLNSGNYVIEATSGSNAVFIDSISIKTGVETTLPADTLKPAGAIKGKVILSLGGDPREVYVLAFGIDRFASVNMDGSFTFSPLAEGKYNLRLITSLEHYKTFDTNQVVVTSADTTDIGKISLSYINATIPVPVNVTSSYDTANQIVTIHWSRLDTAVVKTYNVYATYITGGYNLPNIYNVDAASFIDTVHIKTRTVEENDKVFQDTTAPGIWEYQFSGVNQHGTEGPKSTKIRIKSKIRSDIEMIRSFGQGQSLGTINMAVDDQNNFWVADFDRGIVYRYSQTGDLMTQWSMELNDSPRKTFPGTYPSAMDLDSQKNVYLKDLQSKSIVKYDSSGTLIKKIYDTTGITIFDISVDRKGYLYCNYMKKTDSTQSINKYDLDLNLIKSWDVPLLNSIHHGLLARNGKVYCAGYLELQSNSTKLKNRGNLIEIYDDEGNMRGNILSIADEFAIDKNGIIYNVDAASNMLWITDSSRQNLGNFEISSGLLSISNCLLGIEIMDDGTIALGLGQSDSHSSTINLFRRPQ